MKHLRTLNKFFLKYKWKLILGLVVTIISRIFGLYFIPLVGNSTDAIEQYINGEITGYDSLKAELLKNILLLVGTTLISAFFTFLMRQTFIVVSRHIEYDLKNVVYKHYQELSLNFYKKNRTGDLMNRISEDVSKVRMYLGPAIMYTVTTLTSTIVVLIFMIQAAPVLTLYTVIPLPILSFAIYKLSVAIQKRSTVVQQYLSKLNTFTQESFSGIAVIKSYSLEQQTDNNFTDLSNTSRDKNIDLVKVQAFFFPLMVLLIGISNVLVIYVGGRQYITGQIDNLGIIVEFLLYVNMLTWPVASIGWVTSLVKQAEASQERINEFLDSEPEIKNHKETTDIIKGKVNFKNVTFTYEDTNITALKNISFEVNQGETLAIIGKTGSGKSTVLDLIGRLYDVEEGSIEVDGINVKNLNLDNLKRNIGYVPQDAFLFSDSIRNNIKFGKDNATDEDVIEAAKTASVHQNIKNFSKGYDTVLGERGITLSGGQKQRVSIARAIIQNPQILLFDDCLSAVDTETEEAILSNLFKISRDKTTIIVSHRISSAKNADKIIILEDGNIVQQGTHEKLIKIDGYYKELYAKQLNEKEM
ncbi:ABC transporter ATP-binding protein [Zunongwangia profunda]|uniref:ABC-type multidrug/protein/lipid transporter ATP-binding and permease component n=1 Tax=Zunongwangia profunda (strain DSM 18752 / CCTCC AB 206139 / SM-A87) TaxID=655815 RepID=D5BH30_ZUNPS|nr:ABC transporter ATP-binding protein [Zunongwangia profunda]ADF51204.1 ABC-type multidrug/protein/lipid transporter ATP-binding and permease component [Zunongwangia profunda SM-A87]MAG88566.1 ABC transporter ATP-binding protein [Flavobacteriaceae bacterium]MAS72996.1 ABC transporter ATP-binding protein [Zunongwangia sp.]|tara:strand:- start:1982 stop:3739 length:1758 start_codon:yes stop_codon:yes gene_type:complete